ncbi:hypothetical protein [Vagococcus fessus]|uniref:Uncharacterized protein n=1 Tax=Vagococcus fessus TaxID=120370 RepID=A0A430ABV3_9ENTE|nr:hypothetical protein [Vagococcus fessus]RSU04661.1 hypothetical protein CBF31_01185 [Vagococcus fessus]
MEILKIAGVIFSEKDESVPYQNRLSYKGTILLFILLKNCRGRGCSIAKFQIIMNYMYSSEKQAELIQFLEKKDTFVFLRFDSTIIKTIEFLLADKLINIQNNGSFTLTDKGKQISNTMWEDTEILEFEKKFITSIGSSLTEKLVCDIEKKLF